TCRTPSRRHVSPALATSPPIGRAPFPPPCVVETAASGVFALQAEHVECRYRFEESLQVELPDGFDLDQILGRREQPLRDQDLAGPGLTAEARGEIRHGADGSIVPASFEADGANRRVALRDPDAEVEVVAALAPSDAQLPHSIAHGERHADRAFGRIWDRDGIVEENHHPITREALERALVGEDQAAHLGVVLAENAHDLLWLSGLRERGEAAEVQERDCHLTSVALEGVLGAALDDQLGELRREEALESAEALDLRHLLGDPLLEGLVPLPKLRRLSLEAD